MTKVDKRAKNQTLSDDVDPEEWSGASCWMDESTRVFLEEHGKMLDKKKLEIAERQRKNPPHRPLSPQPYMYKNGRVVPLPDSWLRKET